MKRRETTMIYGTAWKNEQTANLVHKAIESGFRAIDVAAQPKHYREDLVGDGVRESIEGGYVKREDLYVSYSQHSWWESFGSDFMRVRFRPSSVGQQIPKQKICPTTPGLKAHSYRYVRGITRAGKTNPILIVCSCTLRYPRGKRHWKLGKPSKTLSRIKFGSSGYPIAIFQYSEFSVLHSRSKYGLLWFRIDSTKKHHLTQTCGCSAATTISHIRHSGSSRPTVTFWSRSQ